MGNIPGIRGNPLTQAQPAPLVQAPEPGAVDRFNAAMQAAPQPEAEATTDTVTGTGTESTPDIAREICMSYITSEMTAMLGRIDDLRD